MREPKESAPIARTRELLKQCCTRSSGCANEHGHLCDRLPPIEPAALADPGPLEPRGPLSPRVQENLARIAGRRPTLGNRIRLLLDGDQSYGAMLDLIESAQREILLENFILLGDEVGTAFADVLRKRAREGLDVRILLDALGSVTRRRPALRLLLDPSPAALRIFNPPRPTLSFFRGGRDHRKLLAGDRSRAVAGGMCLGDMWLGNCVTHCTWRDSAVLVEGEAAVELGAEFERIWRHDLSRRFFSSERGAPLGAVLPPRSSHRSPGGDGGVPVRVVADDPGDRRVERMLVAVFDSAEDAILITNPYFVPTRPISRALIRAVRRGVTVELVVPRFTDHAIVGLTSEHLMGTFLREGVKVWRWTGPMIHAKTVVVDGCWSLIGSSNLDPLSLRKNRELNLEIHGPAVGEQMAEIFAAATALARSWQ